MNETLEAMARAIFKSWFVDFDPVRAKMEGREPVGIGPRNVPLYSHSKLCQDSPLGEIPEGWENWNAQQDCSQNVRRSAQG